MQHQDDRWLVVIGSSIHDPDLLKLLQEIGVQFTDSQSDNVTQVGDSITFDYYRAGLSFYFVHGKLDSIDFYSHSKKFSQVDLKLLPFGIELSFTGQQFVEKFGEPIEKGGGLNSKLDIWLRWDHLQVEIDEKNWDRAKDANWTSLMIF